jgi:hypothetical protein
MDSYPPLGRFSVKDLLNPPFVVPFLIILGIAIWIAVRPHLG